jgi:hypothetical protein
VLRAVFCLIAAVAASAATAAMEPGEWEFTSVSSSALFPKPQTSSFKRCLKKEEAADPERWMSNPGEQSDCKLTPTTKTPDTYTWTMECPKANMRGSGSARMRGASFEGESQMAGETQGRKFDVRTKVTGRRIGPCKN